jgi:hypothetical protein
MEVAEVGLPGCSISNQRLPLSGWHVICNFLDKDQPEDIHAYIDEPGH